MTPEEIVKALRTWADKREEYFARRTDSHNGAEILREAAKLIEDEICFPDPEREQ